MRSLVLFSRFVGVGLLNTLFGYGLFAGLVLLTLPPALALALAYIGGVIFNFFTIRRFVFNHSGQAVFFRFISAYVLVYVFNLMIYALVESVVTTPFARQALCLPVVAIFSFLLFRFKVFKDLP